jgi:SAM-dependent methyltransferase
VNKTWITHRDRYDRMLAPFGDALMIAAALEPGENVLDIGCGTGTSTLAAAEAVGPGGSVVGVDIDERLAAEARHRLRETPNVSVVTADAAAYRSATPADVAISRFGTMQFDDPTAAHGNVARNLGPGGRLAAVVWQTVEQNFWQCLPLQAVQAHLDLGPPQPPDRPGPFSFARPDRVAAVLEQAGFDEPKVEPVEASVWVATDLDDALRFFDDDAGASLRAMAPDGTVSEVVETLRQLLAPYVTADGVRLPAAGWVVTACVSRTR